MSITLQEAEPVPGLGPDGRPDPDYARGLGLAAAPPLRRSAAFLLDALVFAALAAPAVVGWTSIVGDLWWTGGVHIPSLVLPIVLVAVGHGLSAIYGLIQLLTHGIRGVTIGKAAFGIRSVSVVDFGRVGFWRAVLRVLVLWGAQLVLPLIGPALLFATRWLDPERRGRSWLDRIGRCWAIDVRRGLDPFDSKALRHARRRYESAEREQAAPLPSLASAGAAQQVFVPALRSVAGVVSGDADDGMPAAPSAPAGSPDAAQGERRAVAPPPGAAVQPVVPAAQTAAADGELRASYALVFDDGTRLPLVEPVLMGRNPAVTSGNGTAVLVPLADPGLQLSKTHIEVRPAEAGVAVTDLAATNGTTVVDAGHELRLTPWSPRVLRAGDTVRIGGRSFSITQEDAR